MMISIHAQTLHPRKCNRPTTDMYSWNPLWIPLLNLNDSDALTAGNARARVACTDEEEFRAVAHHPRLEGCRSTDAVACRARCGRWRVADGVDADVVAEVKGGARGADRRVPGVKCDADTVVVASQDVRTRCKMGQ